MSPLSSAARPAADERWLSLETLSSGSEPHDPAVRDGYQPVGLGPQVLGRGLLPRLWIGTLQLSIRCSSIHFLPSLSFPVSVVGRLDGRIAAGSPAGERSSAPGDCAATGIGEKNAIAATANAGASTVPPPNAPCDLMKGDTLVRQAVWFGVEWLNPAPSREHSAISAWFLRSPFAGRWGGDFLECSGVPQAEVHMRAPCGLGGGRKAQHVL
jgi:hypothetical protein